MKKILITAIALLILFLLFRGTGNRDAEYFKSYISDMKNAGEQKDFEEFTDFFSAHYRDSAGLNYIYLKNIIRKQFEKYEKFDAEYSDVTVSDLYSDEAENSFVDINLDVTVTGIRNGIPVELIGVTGNPDNITLTLRKSFIGQWKVVRVEGVDR